MSEQAAIYSFTDKDALLQHLDDTFQKLAGEFADTIKTGMQDDNAPESHLLMPVSFDAKLWTDLVWSHWEKITENETGPEQGAKVLEIMTTYFNGLAEAVAEESFDPRKGSVLPVDQERSQQFDYYDGFDKLEGWKALQAKVRGFGLQCTPFLAPVHDNEQIGIGLVVYSGTTQPLMDFINTGSWGHVMPGSDQVM